MNLTGLSVF